MKKIFITLLCLCPLLAIAKEVKIVEYNVYYPKTCAFISGRVERSANFAFYQVECREGGDLSTYLSAPVSPFGRPVKFKHVPSDVRGYIYLKEVK